ncbi:MAG: HAMP domain-containing sensor histidine kinase [Candidatus Binatia bacterium]
MRQGDAQPDDAQPDQWLAGAIVALAGAHDRDELTAVMAHHLEAGADAVRVEWWRRNDDGSYRSPRGRRAGCEAVALDLWVASGPTWQRHETSTAGPDAQRVLTDLEADLIVPLRAQDHPLGFLVLGARPERGAYAEDELVRLRAFADHFGLVAERVHLASKLDESQRMLQQATRLSTVGTLAAELAHEIRNPLVAVQTFLQLLPERLDDPEVTIELRGVALTELQRVARLLNELLGMARASVATFAATDLETLVDEVVRFLQVSARKKDVVLERVGDPLPSGAADASRLKQALVNLVLNAIQASPDGETVTVATRTVVDDGGRQIVELAIHDRGPGIPEDQRESVFNPFFTTKDNGTGLGLPVTRQIIADHGGSIVVEGTNGPGATFIIRLPLTPPAERQDPPVATRAA